MRSLSGGSPCQCLFLPAAGSSAGDSVPMGCRAGGQRKPRALEQAVVETFHLSGKSRAGGEKAEEVHTGKEDVHVSSRLWPFRHPIS